MGQEFSAEQELELLTAELRRVQMEDIGPAMTGEERGRALDEILRVLREGE